MALTDGIVGKWGFNGNVQGLSGKGYNGTVYGNVSYGSDVNGTYMFCDGDRVNSSTGTEARVPIGNVMGLSYTTDFSMSWKGRSETLPSSQSTGLFGSSFDCAFARLSTGAIRVGARSGGTVDLYDIPYAAVPLSTMTHLCLTYVASTTKFYVYLNGVLQNSGGTTTTAAFVLDARGVGDPYIMSGNTTSSQTYHYSAIVRNRTLSDKEVAQLANTQLGKMEIAKNAVFYNLNEQ